MNEITIPPEALEAAARAICRERCAFMGEPPCFEIGEGLSPQCDEPGCAVKARAACQAMLAAWPGMERDRILRGRNDGSTTLEPRIILPLTEKPNAEA